MGEFGSAEKLCRSALAGDPMKIVFLVLSSLFLCGNALAGTATETLKFAIVRNGEQIGTSTTNIQRNGPETVVNIATHVEVKLLGFTAYRYDHSSNERWMDGRLIALTSQTDDNGTKHHLNVDSNDNKLIAAAGGKEISLDANTIPASLWNSKLVSQTAILDTVDGKMKRISVVDLGMENISVRGQATKARHFSTHGQLEHDLWYDEHDHLVQLQLTGSDGSVITYRLT